jgi:hypothetical protein
MSATASPPMSSAEGRTSDPSRETPEYLAPFARYYTAVAEEILGRSGFAVRVVNLGPTATSPAGVTDFDTGTIYLNGALLGSLDGLSMDDAPSIEKVSVLEGLLRREIGRLEHSVPMDAATGSISLAAAAALLEELRVEARVVAAHPEHAQWMRTAASVTTLGTLDLSSFNASFRTITAATLTLGRIHAGTLLAPDVADLVGLFRAALGDEVVDGLEGIFSEVVQIADGDVNALTSAASRLLGLVGRLGGAGVRVAVEQVDGASSTVQSAEESERAGRSPSRAIAEAQRAPADDELSGIDSTRGDRSSDAKASGSDLDDQVEVGSRAPTEAELIERNRMIRIFREARFRDREMVQSLRSVPPGRLRVAGLVQLDAALANGALSSSANVFERRRHRVVDEPIISVGLVVDTSGSMSGKERVLGGALYTVASAVESAGGTVAIAGFGEALAPLSSPGVPLGGVPVFEARGGTEHLVEAIEFVARVASLEVPRHVRQLYILSDGAWTDAVAVDTILSRLESAGCSVLVIDIGRVDPPPGAFSAITIRDVHELADYLSRRFEDAYRRLGV